MPAKKKNLPTRDPNIPVLAFIVGTTEYHVLVASDKQSVPMAHKGGKYNWSPDSIVVREYNIGLKEDEAHLYDAAHWGWIGRLMADRTLEVVLLTPSDEDVQRYKLSLDSDKLLAEKARNFQGIYEQQWFYGKRSETWKNSILHREHVKKIQQRLEYLRNELREGRISYEELAELQCFGDDGLLDGDLELMEAAGLPEPTNDK